MGDKWLIEYEACAGHGQDIMQLINDRNRLQRDSTTYTRKSAEVRSEIAKFSRDLTTLRDGLNQSTSRRLITEREADRRQAMLDQLATKQRQIELAFANDTQRNEQRTALFTGTNPFETDDPWSAGSSSSAYATGGSAAAMNNDLSVNQLRSQQQQIIEEQDRGLDALSRIIGRQKQIAVQIGNEVESQNEIIDDIHDHMDTTNTRLIRETKHIRILDRKSGACWMYVVIVLLLVAIVVLVCIPR